MIIGNVEMMNISGERENGKLQVKKRDREIELREKLFLRGIKNRH